MWSKETPATDAINDSIITGIVDKMFAWQEQERIKWLKEKEIEELQAIETYNKYSDNNSQ